MAKPLPLHAELEELLVDYHAWKARAEEDGVITGDEALQIIAAIEAAVPMLSMLLVTVAFIATTMQGARGMFSERAMRRWREAQSRYADIAAA